MTKKVEVMDTKKQIVFVLFVIVVFCSIPLFFEKIYDGHDLDFHLRRINGIYEGIIDKKVNLRIQSGWYDDYGYAVGVFYGDILLYFPALLRSIGLSIIASYKCFIFAINFLTVFISYYCFSRIYGYKIGLTLSFFYSTSIYRLVDIYLRHAVGEYCAIAFLPVVVLAFNYLINDNYIDSTIAFVIGWTGIIQSHVLSTELVLGFSVLFCIIQLRSIFCINRVISLSVSAFAVLTVNASFLIPFLDYSIQNECNITQRWRGGSIQDHGLYVRQLFNLFPQSKGISSIIAQGIENDMPLTVGVSLIIGLMIAIMVCLSTGRNNTELKLFCALAVLSLFMSTVYFPWDSICKIGALRRFIVNIQFSWRFLEIALVFIVLSMGETFRHFGQEIKKNSYLKVMILSLSFVSIVSASYYMACIPSLQDKKDYSNANEIDSSRWDEYLPVGAENIKRTCDYYANNTQVTNYKKEHQSIQFEYSSTDNSYVVLPLFAYKYYLCTITNKTTHETDVIHPETKDTLICVSLPDNSSGIISVDFTTPALWIIADYVSFVSVVIGLVIIFMYKRKYMITTETV